MIQLFLPHEHPHFCHSYITRFDEDFSQRKSSVFMNVVERSFTNFIFPIMTEEDVLWSSQTVFKRPRCNNRLKKRAGLIAICNCTVSPLIGGISPEEVRVIR